MVLNSRKIDDAAVQFIQAAASYLENPSFVIKVTNIIGMPIEKGIEALPKNAQDLVASATRKSLDVALGIAIRTIRSDNSGSFETGQKISFWTDWGHRALSVATGAAGGAFGLAALPFELPITTGIMLRGITSIADSYGLNIKDTQIQLECLSVFAMGSPSVDDDALDSAYFTSRIAMAQSIEQAAKWAATKTAQEITEAVAAKTAPAVIQVIAKIAARFNVVVTEALVAKAVPGVAIAAGALINGAFAAHFNAVARYHFGIKSLEARFGESIVHAEYNRLK